MGIRQRVAGSYLAVILTTVIILELFLIVSVKYYYLHNVERILTNQAEISASFFRQYFEGRDLEEQSGRLLSGFSENSAAQVQIVDASGRLLQDSNGLSGRENVMAMPDVKKAIGGFVGTWQGREPVTNEPVLSVSYPLQGSGRTVGAVRFVTSLTETYRTIKQVSAVLIAVGCIVVAIVAILGVFLSRSITRSIQELKRAAEKMGEGDFSIRVAKRADDELGTLADTLNLMAAKIGQTEQLKNDFISSVSHELRTPLTAIKGWTVTLRTADKESEEGLLRDGLEIIESESDRLARLVDELLDFSKRESGRIVLQPAPVHLPELLDRIAKQLTPRAERQRVSLRVHASDALPVIQADENRLKQVLINLVDNSLKFTPPDGSIRIEAFPDQGEVVIAVADTGSGIAERDLASVFQKFYKGEGKTGGSGLGLAISEQMIKLHNGRMHIDSELGKGTKVWIRLPG
ncbi:sensor histidine kinase [Cohnella nanjingensis]|uniref:histidine kinase n=1 Tax=Cohnella nanjingensis TaxID=1387779 RepID=A0A7X0VEH6_9BACL|nr:ATP-binding protein [Cohnella nanjingensis]MBB6670721.1 HAMP domain-containing protein [Cohnella nanjingensis]